MTPTQALLDKLELLLRNTDFIRNPPVPSDCLFQSLWCQVTDTYGFLPRLFPAKYRVLRFCDFAKAVPGHLLCTGQQLVQRDFFRVFSFGQNLV